MLPFENQELIDFVNNIKPVETPVLDRHFGRTRQAAASVVQVDVVEGPGGIMVAISWDAESRKARGRTVSSKAVSLPRFSEHDFVGAVEQLQYRQPGTLGGPQAFIDLVGGKLADLRATIDRTKEFMAIKALQGEVVDGDGNVLATYPVPAAVPVDFSTADAVDVFDDAVVAITQALGYQPAAIAAYAGIDAYKAIRGNEKIQKLLYSPAGVPLVTTGKLPMVSGLTIDRIAGQYVDNNGDVKDFLDPNAVVIAPVDASFLVVYGPCVAKGGQLALLQYYADQTDKDDPPVTKVRVESNPLPIVNRPQAVYTITST